MTDLTDFDIDERPAAPEPPPPPRYESERSPLIWVALAIALGAIAAGVSFWLNRSPGTAPDFSFFRLEFARQQMPKELRKMSDIDPADCPAEPTSDWDLDPYDIQPPA